MAAASLGLDYLGASDPIQELVDEPGLIRLFRIGWHITQGLSLSVARQLRRFLETADYSESPRAWMFDEISAELVKPQFLEDIEAGEFEAVHEAMHMLSLLLPFAACAQLRAFVNDLPHIVAEVTEGDEPEVSKYRYFSSLDDLDEVDALFEGMAQSL